MAKRVQLVLNQDVSKLGKSGEVVEVAPGYARNYLLPQGLAVHVTRGVLKQVERRREVERLRLLDLKKEADVQKVALQKMGTLSIAKAVGEGDSIFGTVTDRELTEIIQEKTGIELDRRNIDVPDIRKTGEYTVELKLHPDVSVMVSLNVVAEAEA